MGHDGITRKRHLREAYWVVALLISSMGYVRIVVMSLGLILQFYLTPVIADPYVQGQAKAEVVLEVKFEQDGARVEKNEVGRLISQGRFSEFPIKSMVRKKEKKIVWFDPDGTIRNERIFEDAIKLLVTQDGNHGVVARAGKKYGSYEAEFLDDRGNSLWKRDIGDKLLMSPTGETLLTGRSGHGYNTFYDEQGNKRVFHHRISGSMPAFSRNGMYMFCNVDFADSNYVALFDKTGQLIWKRLSKPYKEENAHRVAISDDGRYMAVSRTTGRNNYYIAVLDRDGNLLWKKKAGIITKLDFSTDGKSLATLERKNAQSRRERNIPLNRHITIFRTNDGENLSMHSISSDPNLNYVDACYLQLMNDGRQLLGLVKKDMFNISLYDFQGNNIWEHQLTADTSEYNAWIDRGDIVGIKAKDSFKVYDFRDKNNN